MDMDLRPPTRPQPLPPQQPVQQLPQEDPFKPDSQQFAPPSHSGKVKKSRGKGIKTFLKLLLILILLGGAAYGVYYWQQQNIDKLTSENQALIAESAANKAKLESLESEDKEDTVAAPTTDEQVIAVVTGRCVAGVDDTTKKPLVYTQGTAGTETKKVLYSTDKNFAYINSSCSTTAENSAGTARASYLKLVNGEWVFLYSGQAADPTATKLYAIPALADFK